MESLTPRQQEILQLIRDTLEATGFPPPAPRSHAHSASLRPTPPRITCGRWRARVPIELTEGVARGIRLAEPPGLAVIGRVAAGRPILAEQHVQARIQMDPALFSPRADYLLKVRGMSMRDAGILDGDLLAVHRTTEVRSGQIVVARLENEVTVKRLRRRAPPWNCCPKTPSSNPSSWT